MVDKPDKVAFGITSLCEDGSHIFMTDIDNDSLSYDTIKDVLSTIINEYMLSNIYVIKSSHGYNAYSLDKLPIHVVYDINKSFPTVLDQQYNELQFSKRDFYTLRIGADKEVFDILPSKYNIYMRSNAHRIFFNNVFSLHVGYEVSFFDDFEGFRIIRFLNGKHGVDAL